VALGPVEVNFSAVGAGPRQSLQGQSELGPI